MNSDELHVILGAGPLGQAVMRELVKRDKHVTMVNHSGKRPLGMDETVQIIAADLYDPQAVTQVTRTATVVYQCAQPAYTEWPQKFPPLMKSIITGMTGTGATLVMGDNLYMYGNVDGPIHEDLPHNAKGPKGLTRAHIADELSPGPSQRQPARDDWARLRLLRPGSVRILCR